MASRLPPALVDLHRRNNRDSAGSWERFSAHRARVTDLTAAAGAGTLCVLGAGNVNDLELDRLDRFREIHLVDLDGAALVAARDRQAPEVRQRLSLHAPVDLSGALPWLRNWRDQAPTPRQLAALPGASSAAVLAAIPVRAEVVLSACFLSQLMRTCFVALGARHPALHAIAAGLVIGHLRALVKLVAPGGTALLVTDAATSDSYPLEELWDEQPPDALLAHLEDTENVFAGTGPRFVQRAVREDPDAGPLLADAPRMVTPWLWRFTEERTYLVYAMVARVRG